MAGLRTSRETGSEEKPPSSRKGGTAACQGNLSMSSPPTATKFSVAKVTRMRKAFSRVLRMSAFLTGGSRVQESAARETMHRKRLTIDAYGIGWGTRVAEARDSVCAYLGIVGVLG